MYYCKTQLQVSSLYMRKTRVSEQVVTGGCFAKVAYILRLKNNSVVKNALSDECRQKMDVVIIRGA